MTPFPKKMNVREAKYSVVHLSRRVYSLMKKLQSLVLLISIDVNAVTWDIPIFSEG
jgi:hypothetical protein